MYDYDVRIDTKAFTRTSKLISKLCAIPVSPNKAVVGSNAFAHESGIHQHGMLNHPNTYEIMTPESVGAEKTNIVLGKHSGRHAFDEHLVSLGIFVGETEKANLFQRFKELADRKKQVFDEDIMALVTESFDHEKAFTLEHHDYKSEPVGYATASVAVNTPNGVVHDAAVGDGPVDASFKAIERAVNTPFVLEDYQIRAVTSGKDALGEAIVKVIHKGRRFSGRGVSTDIIKASVNAYINAVNGIYLAKALEETFHEEQCKG